MDEHAAAAMLLDEHADHAARVYPNVDESRLGKIEDSNDGKPRSASTEAYRKLDARLSEQSSSARDLMTTMLGANTVSAAELQKRKLATRDADESIQHLAFLFEERAAASRLHRIQCQTLRAPGTSRAATSSWSSSASESWRSRAC